MHIYNVYSVCSVMHVVEEGWGKKPILHFTVNTDSLLNMNSMFTHKHYYYLLLFELYSIVQVI